MGQSNTENYHSTGRFRFSRAILMMDRQLKKSNNQRRHPRRTSYIIVEYTVQEGTFRDIMKNVGAKGIFINTQRDIAEGQPISLKFPLFDFDHIMQANGRVTRCHTNGFAVVLDQPIAGLICKEGQFPKIVHEIDRLETS
jgi:hypothetical protein